GRAEIGFDDSSPGQLVITTPTYELTLSRASGALVELVEAASGARLLHGQNGCAWGVVPDGDASYVGGCSFSARGRSRFSYSWDRRSATLRLTYAGDSAAVRRVDAAVELTVHD